MKNIKKKKNNKVELLAPAGSIEGFYGAIQAGADAVYLAGNRFGARAYAENFTTEVLLECIRYGHLLGRKLYLAVNTLLKDHEINELLQYLQPFYEAGLDAVIVQDLGVLRFIKAHFPGWKIHVSTQMTLCGGYGASLLKEMGACRIVPARELSLEELVTLKRQADIELETFIHGAMCYSYSGQCLFSSILGGRSGNRGRCAQPCRLSYTVMAGSVKCEDCYPLSLKDMCTIEHIPQFIQAGIDSFKIEGRMKKPEYAAGVTSVYRRYIDRYYELCEKMGPEKASEAYHVEKEDWKLLRSLYIRSEVQNGYYFKHNGREMVTMKSPSYSGSDEAMLTDLREKYINTILKLPVTIKAVFQVGQPGEVTLQWQGISVSVVGAVTERAQKQPITEENAKKQLGKLGDSAFYVDEMQVSVEENAFYPLKQINELRRVAVARLEEQILLARGYGRQLGSHKLSGEAQDDLPNILSGSFSSALTGWAVSLHTKPQLEAAVDWICANRVDGIMRVYVDGDLIVQEWDAVFALCQKLLPYSAIYAALPYVLRESDNEYLEQLYKKMLKSKLFSGFLARSMDGIGFIRQKGKTVACRADAGVYVWNKEALQEISTLAEGFCLPYELNASEQRCLLNLLPCEKIVYSRIPMMITANCLCCTMKQCKKGIGSHAVLKDRYRKDFPVDINCLHCMNIVYNSVPFSLYSELSKWKGRVDLRMDFTLESPEEVVQLLDAFLWGATLPQGKYTATTGHEKRGVE